jgi:hypothetical protein
VNRVKIDRAAVTLVLHKPGPNGAFATSVTLHWPTPLSKDFEEREQLDRLLLQFILLHP